MQAGGSAADNDDVGFAGLAHGRGTVARITLWFSHPSAFRHDTGAHPENARRLAAIERALEATGWHGLERLDAEPATRKQLTRVHTLEHVEAIESFCAAGGGMIDADTITVADSFEAASRAAGGAAEAAERLLAGESRSAFVAMRPPGHHAEAARAMGFCLFNTAAVAARHAIAQCGAERVLILDWDVHHGNGTEAIFAGDDDVLYASIHQSPLYPGTGAADYEGEGDGVGFTINLPVPAGADGEVFRSLVEHVVVPVARRYEPGLLVISAGYDAHRDDPLASCLVDTRAYGELTAAVRDAGAQLRAPVLVCLEGGYSPIALAASVEATLAALAGDLDAAPAPAEPAASHRERVAARWELAT